MADEKWKIVVGFDTYAVSDQGRIRNLNTGELLKLKHSNRYQEVTLYINKKPHYARVHVLILTAFIGPRPEGLIALHGDDDPVNNRLSNLRWGTHSDNQADRKKTLIGRYYPGRPPSLTHGEVDRILDLKAAGFGATAIMRWLGLKDIPRKLMKGGR